MAVIFLLSNLINPLQLLLIDCEPFLLGVSDFDFDSEVRKSNALKPHKQTLAYENWFID